MSREYDIAVAHWLAEQTRLTEEAVTAYGRGEASHDSALKSVRTLGAGPPPREVPWWKRWWKR